MFNQLEHIGIMVDDLDRSIRFYTEVLGLELVERRPFKEAEIAFVRVGETLLELVCNHSSYVREDAVVNHVAFRVHDLEAALAQLRSAGVELITPEPVAIWDNLRVAFFRGPDGEKLELFERT